MVAWFQLSRLPFTHPAVYRSKTLKHSLNLCHPVSRPVLIMMSIRGSEFLETITTASYQYNIYYSTHSPCALEGGVWGLGYSALAHAQLDNVYACSTGLVIIMLYTLIFLLTSARIDPAEGGKFKIDLLEYNICYVALFLLHHMSDLLFTGLVEISPSGVAPVCQAGDQLELTCSATGAFLRWEFTVIRESEPAMPFRVMPIVTSNGPSGVPPPVTANSTRFTFSRFSAQDSTPLISMLTINPVSEGLNGVEVKCMDVELPSESVATTIRIVGTGGRLKFPKWQYYSTVH